MEIRSNKSRKQRLFTPPLLYFQMLTFAFLSSHRIPRVPFHFHSHCNSHPFSIVPIIWIIFGIRDSRCYLNFREQLNYNKSRCNFLNKILIRRKLKWEFLGQNRISSSNLLTIKTAKINITHQKSTKRMQFQIIYHVCSLFSPNINRGENVFE